MARIRSPRFVYVVGWNTVQGWYLERVSRGRVERFELDHDRRHQRFFLSEHDQKKVGVEGLVALERLARVALPMQR
jgi:hypothetical protein